MDQSPPLEQTGIGVVVPYDFALDRELWRWVSPDITLHVTRMSYVPLAATMEMAIHISDPALLAQGATDLLAVSRRSPPTRVRREVSSEASRGVCTGDCDDGGRRPPPP